MVGTQLPNHLVSERFERKFFIPPGKEYFAKSLLSHLCLRDREFPQNRVTSLYFDTPDLEQFQKSDDGYHQREKIRIRWYDDSAVEGGMIPVYLELKRKRGYLGSKQRKRLLVPQEHLNRINGSDTIINRNTIKETLAEFGYYSDAPLLPVIVVTYKRIRFIEILTGARLSFDWGISSSLTSPWLGFGEGSQMIEGSIIEIKDPSMEIPISLRSLRSLSTDWSRFSKYAFCLESQIERPGSFGRSWPSGRAKS